MRRTTWIVLAAAGLWLAGCASAPSGPVAITQIDGDVTGYDGAVDVAFEGRFSPVLSVVATGTLDAASATFSAELGAVPPTDLQTIEEHLAPLLGKGGTCDLTVTPDDLSIGVLSNFVDLDDEARLQLAVHDPWSNDPPTVGDTAYHLVFATREGALTGSCTSVQGHTRTYAMPLARGWNTVAVRVMAVEGTTATATRWRTEAPSSDAMWWYQELLFKKLAAPQE